MKRIPRICRARGCTTFTTNTSGRCDDHQRVQRRAYQQQTAYYHMTEWRHLRAACLERDHRQCVVCTGTERLTAHHIRARARGGRDELGNLVTLCGACHSSIETGDEDVVAGLRLHLAVVRGERPNP